MRTTFVMTLALVAAACASAPPLPPKPPAAPTFEQKMSWIVRLEDQRMLRDPAPPPLPAPAPPMPERRGKAIPIAPPAPPPAPDLITLLGDDEARIRRRAALAVGHVGLSAGVDPLVNLLRDADPEVRQMAAFALGLLGDKRARDPLVAALSDASPLVQGSAAEALGLIGDPAAAAPIGRLAASIVDSGAFAQVPGEDADLRRDLPVSVFRLAIYALVRLKAYEPLAAAVLDPAGQPRVSWWPVAYALQRIEDKRAFAALTTLAANGNPYTRAFAAKGLGGVKDPAAVPTLGRLVTSPDHGVAIEAVRALGRIGDPSAGPALQGILQMKNPDPQLRLEALTAVGAVHAAGLNDLLLDLLTDPNPNIRAAALRSLAAFDREQFVAVLSGLDADPNWTVRAALASILGTFDPMVGLPRLRAMLADQDQRVIPAVLESLVKLRAPDAGDLLVQRLKADDPGVRAAAADGIGELKPPAGDQRLAEAYDLGVRDPTFTARAAALDALSKYGAAAATPTLRKALADADWAVRLKAALLLKQFDPAMAEEIDRQIRPAPTTVSADVYQAARVVNPPVSTLVYLDTDRGTIEIELAVLDAPLTVENFITLARRGFFNGLNVHRVVPDFVIQSGDPRGDGEGGPGYTIRDELNERPYVRGTVGMALDPWPDTGGSQFFITHSPQPHLDAKYTVFGRVVSGMDVVDAIQQGDVIRRVRVWDGQTSQ